MIVCQTEDLAIDESCLAQESLQHSQAYQSIDEKSASERGRDRDCVGGNQRSDSWALRGRSQARRTPIHTGIKDPIAKDQQEPL